MILKNFRLVNEHQVIKNSYLVIENDKIVEIGTDYQGNDGIDLNDNYLLPGFIDRHSHGGYLADIMYNDKAAVEKILSNIVKEGTTSYLATTLTQDFNTLIEVAKKCYELKDTKVGANLVGIHLEGPFINEAFKGAQNPAYIVPGNIEMFDKFLEVAPGFIKEITYAPELTTPEFTSHVRKSGCIASVGHSEATFDDVRRHVEAGLNSVTHFHNGQSLHHHRTPGVVSAGFTFDELDTEIIVDGIHLNKDVVYMVYKIKGADKISLITDSMEAKGCPDGTYDLGGLAVVKKGEEVRTESGSLAGSILKFNLAVKNIMAFTGCGFSDIVKMSSLNQAKLLGLDDRKGRIKVGYDADLVCLDKDCNVLYTIVMGEIKYENK